jgi:hypothetical protein
MRTRWTIIAGVSTPTHLIKPTSLTRLTKRGATVIRKSCSPDPLPTVPRRYGKEWSVKIEAPNIVPSSLIEEKSSFRFVPTISYISCREFE